MINYNMQANVGFRISDSKAPSLSGKDIHVWCVSLDLSERTIQTLQEHLSDDEQKRKKAFYFQEHRRRYIAARGLLRTLLGHYLDCHPAHLEFSYSERGKPKLKTFHHEKKLCFNLSHSNELALYAVSYERSIGVDIEYIEHVREVEQLAQSFFFPGEYELISSLPEALKSEAFYNIWTCKEAYLKARGEGLSGLKNIEIPEELAVPSDVGSSQEEVSGFSMYRLIVPQPGYAASLVAEGKGCHISFYRMNTF